MKNFVLTLILTLLCFTAKAEEDRLVELSWEPITGAVSYEIEVAKVIDDQYQSPVTETTYSFNWRKKLPSGEYAYRIRSLDYRKVPGPWSEYVKFYVNLPSVELIRPYENEIIEGIKSERLDMLFAWTEVVGARYYLLEVQDEKKKTVYKKLHSDTKNYVSLRTANVYSWRVEALQTKSDPIPPFPDNARTLDIKGAPLEPVDIQLKRSRKGIIFRWNRSKGAKHYAYHLYQKKGSNWVKLTSKDKYKKRGWFISAKKLKKDEYKFIVDAKAPGRSASKRSTVIFSWSGKRVSDTVKKLEDPISVSSSTQAIKLVRSPHEAFFSFSSPTGDYSGYEDQTQSNVADTLSTQRFAGGYHYTTPNNNTIWSIAAEMNNYVNASEAWQMYSADLLYEKYWGTKYRFDAGGGLFYKMSPWISVDPNTASGVPSTITTIGTAFSAKFRMQVTTSVFFQIDALFRLHLLGLDLPEGSVEPSVEQRIIPKILYRYGDLVDFMIGFEMSSIDVSFTGERTGESNNAKTDISGLFAGVTIPF